jgi:serine protease Do
VTPELARQFGLPTNAKGVLIQRVDPSSKAAQAGLAPGDVILEVNRNPVTTLEQMNRYLSTSKDLTLLFVSRDGRTRYVVIPSN